MRGYAGRVLPSTPSAVHRLPEPELSLLVRRPRRVTATGADVQWIAAALAGPPTRGAVVGGVVAWVSDAAGSCRRGAAATVEDERRREVARPSWREPGASAGAERPASHAGEPGAVGKPRFGPSAGRVGAKQAPDKASTASRSGETWLPWPSQPQSVGSSAFRAGSVVGAPATTIVGCPPGDGEVRSARATGLRGPAPSGVGQRGESVRTAERGAYASRVGRLDFAR